MAIRHGSSRAPTRCGNTAGRTCESLVGTWSRDAMRTTYGTDFPFHEQGGLRADLTCPRPDNRNDFSPRKRRRRHDHARGKVSTCSPREHRRSRSMMNGAELKQMLENGVSGCRPRRPLPGRLRDVLTYNINSAGSRSCSVRAGGRRGECTGAASSTSPPPRRTRSLERLTISGGDSYPKLIVPGATRRDHGSGDSRLHRRLGRSRAIRGESSAPAPAARTVTP
jgi:hypothetical protein